jgi:hypothetical protein
MIIIIKHILAKTTKQDIAVFLNPIIKGGLLQKSGQILGISILAQRNTRTQVMQYHSLVKIEPDTVAKRVVSRLNGKVMRGKRVSVSEYHKRSWRNDPRLNKDNIFNKWLDNKRSHERRVKHTLLKPEELHVDSQAK